MTGKTQSVAIDGIDGVKLIRIIFGQQSARRGCMRQVAGVALPFAKGQVLDGLLVFKLSLDGCQRAALRILELRAMAAKTEFRRLFDQQALVFRGVMLMAAQALSLRRRTMRSLALELVFIMTAETQLRRRLLEQFCLVRLMRIMAFGACATLDRFMEFLFCLVFLVMTGVTQRGFVCGDWLEGMLAGFNRLVAFHAGGAFRCSRMDVLFLEKIGVACRRAIGSRIDLCGRLRISRCEKSK